jgi:hypothetical protein
MRKTLVMLAVILPVTLGPSAYAHHSHFYDQCNGRSALLLARTAALM